jgi:hypothetical protein
VKSIEDLTTNGLTSKANTMKRKDDISLLDCDWLSDCSILHHAQREICVDVYFDVIKYLMAHDILGTGRKLLGLFCLILKLFETFLEIRIICDYIIIFSSYSFYLVKLLLLFFRSKSF